MGRALARSPQRGCHKAGEIAVPETVGLEQLRRCKSCAVEIAAFDLQRQPHDDLTAQNAARSVLKAGLEKSFADAAGGAQPPLLS
jgi:hypothetical protein